MRLLLQSDIVVWIGVGYVIFVYGLLFSYARKVPEVDAVEQSTPAEHRSPYV
jgi:hypothetical protein